MNGNSEGSFHIVGVGPGDPELLTLKGARILEEADVIVAPRGRKEGVSVALSIAGRAVCMNGKKTISIHFPMHRVDLDGDNSHAETWGMAGRTIVEHVRNGYKVVFPTLGDPAFYSTGFYVAAAIHMIDASVKVSVIPGVSAVGGCSASAAMPVALAGEITAIVPAVFDDGRLADVMGSFDSLVLMKVHNSMDRIISLLERLDLIDCAVLVEKTSMAGERIWTDLRRAPREGLHYFSTVLVRKKDFMNICR